MRVAKQVLKKRVSERKKRGGILPLCVWGYVFCISHVPGLDRLF